MSNLTKTRWNGSFRSVVYFSPSTFIDPVFVDVEMDVPRDWMRILLILAGKKSVRQDAPFAIEFEAIVMISLDEFDYNLGIFGTIHFLYLQWND